MRCDNATDVPHIKATVRAARTNLCWAHPVPAILRTELKSKIGHKMKGASADKILLWNEAACSLRGRLAFVHPCMHVHVLKFLQSAQQQELRWDDAAYKLISNICWISWNSCTSRKCQKINKDFYACNLNVIKNSTADLQRQLTWGGDSSVGIGRFSEAGLLEWMRFVIFRARSHEWSQRTSGPISDSALLHAVYNSGSWT